MRRAGRATHVACSLIFGTSVVRDLIHGRVAAERGHRDCAAQTNKKNPSRIQGSHGLPTLADTTDRRARGEESVVLELPASRRANAAADIRCQPVALRRPKPSEKRNADADDWKWTNPTHFECLAFLATEPPPHRHCVNTSSRSARFVGQPQEVSCALHLSNS